MKNCRVLLVATAIMFSASWLATAQERRRAPRREIENYFSPNGGKADAVVRELDKAQKSIYIAMYSVSTGSTAPIFAAMRRAAERGVKVRMIFNHARRGARNKAKSLSLERIGVDVRYVTRTMHEKFAIVDSKLLLTGSANWSTSADTKHSENMQIIASPKYVVTAFKREFRLLMDKSKDFDPREFQP
jgi:phosphatidylserine/phosphatidylglycerophosphate/cardiolipin synthase-like enzyme